MEWHSTFLDFGTPYDTVAPGFDGFQAGFLSPPSTLQSSFTAPTLVRVRGGFSSVVLVPAAISGLEVQPQVAAGIIPWKDINDTVPAAADLPSPLLDGEFDWLWHSFLPVVQVLNPNPILTNVAHSFVTGSLQLDSKAMRKMPTGFGLLFVVTCRNPAGGYSGVQFGGQVGCRMLYKE